MASIRPRVIGVTMVADGAAHKHKFKDVPWDYKRLGPDFTDPDTDHGGELEFPMATFKTLLRCSCGAESVESVRALY